MWPDLISEVLQRADEDEAVALKPAETAEEDKTLPPLNMRNSETALSSSALCRTSEIKSGHILT